MDIVYIKKSLLKTLRGCEILRYVMETLRRKEAKEKVPVIKMEIDYQLVTLHDAIKANDKVEMIKAKEKLEQLRAELLKIESE